MTVRLVHHGRLLGSRFTAKVVRDTVEPALRRGEPVCFDFTGVESVTESFVHELLRLPEGVPGTISEVTFANCNRTVVDTIRFVMKEALHSGKAPAFT
jgi:hypothetical protein